MIRSELNANQIPDFVIHEKPCTAHTDVKQIQIDPNCEQDPSQIKSELNKYSDQIVAFNMILLRVNLK